jgi:hypothetical protein
LKQLLLLAAACTGAVTLAASAGATVTRDPFAGVWVGIEIPVGDGSTDTMAISGPNSDGSRNWRYYETNASGYCSPGGGGPLSAAGTASAVGATLTVTVTFTRCGNGQSGAFPPPFQITMTSLGNGKIDSSGVIFTRLGSG